MSSEFLFFTSKRGCRVGLKFSRTLLAIHAILDVQFAYVARQTEQTQDSQGVRVLRTLAYWLRKGAFSGARPDVGKSIRFRALQRVGDFHGVYQGAIESEDSDLG